MIAYNYIFFKLQHGDLRRIWQCSWKNQISSHDRLRPPGDSILLKEWEDDFSLAQTKDISRTWQMPHQATPSEEVNGMKV